MALVSASGKVAQNIGGHGGYRNGRRGGRRRRRGRRGGRYTAA